MSTTVESAPEQQTFAFQAEIKQLLDIVIHSLYTDKEIFIRELISNAADALEKFRYKALTTQEISASDDTLEVRIELDKDARTIAFVDNGVGMTREDLVDNLGTIASSGTKKFLAALKEGGKPDINLIGQFGVGFYSSFMVAKKVTVETRSYHPDAQGYVWESDGSGSYTITHKEGLNRGTRITVALQEEFERFAETWEVKNIVRKFSSFVAFPVSVDGERVNTVQAIWTRSKSEITDEEYQEFYKFVANAYDEPRYRLHFTADAPLAIKALIFVSKTNPERLGFGRSEPGVDLYCRKVLIQKHPENLLPEWMRFVRGVIDSDDLPLNISRETMQDSALVRKLSKVITGRFLKFLAEESSRDTAAYNEFYEAFGRFLKEGVTVDATHRDELAKLLRFETSKTKPGETASFADYLSRLQADQTDIYYINGPTRAAIEAGPYIEALRARDLEVIYNFDQIDDFVFDHLREVEGKKLVSADRGDLELKDIDQKEGAELSKEDAEALTTWLKGHYGNRVGTVKTSKRLVNNPAVAVTDGFMTATMQRLMMSMKGEESMGGGSLTLEINPRNPFILKLHELRTGNESFAQQLADQLLDNALLAAGLLQDPRGMVERLNALLSKAAGA